MRTIRKYQAPISYQFTLPLPKGFEILSLQTQGNRPTLWASVDSDNEVEDIEFAWVASGEHIPERSPSVDGDDSDGYEWLYIDTVQLMSSSEPQFVLHLYEKWYYG